MIVNVIQEMVESMIKRFWNAEITFQLEIRNGWSVLL